MRTCSGEKDFYNQEISFRSLQWTRIFGTTKQTATILILFSFQNTLAGVTPHGSNPQSLLIVPETEQK
jgi:hypothetical protein